MVVWVEAILGSHSLLVWVNSHKTPTAVAMVASRTALDAVALVQVKGNRAVPKGNDIWTNDVKMLVVGLVGN